MQEQDPQKRHGRPVRYYHHSQSPAAWAGVIIATLGFLAATVGSMMGPNWLLVYIGAGLVVLALIVGNILKAVGLGQG